MIEPSLQQPIRTDMDEPVPTALLSIGDYATEVGMAVSAVRFYADRGILIPAEVDSTSGYRRFDESQIGLGRLIVRCRQMKMSLAQIAQLVSEPAQAQLEIAAQHVDRLERDTAHMRGLLRAFEPPAPEQACVVSARKFGDALRHAVTAAGTNPERPDLMAVRVEVRDASLRIAATDRHRLTVRDLVPGTSCAPFVGTYAAATMKRWANSLCQLDGLVELSVTPKSFQIRGGAFQEAAEVLAVDFPAYERVLNPTTPPVASATIDRSTLGSALEVLTDPRVSFSTAREQLSITSASGNESLPAATVGVFDGVVLERRYVLDALDSSLGDDVVLETRSRTEPVAFRSADTGTAVTMVMPII